MLSEKVIKNKAREFRQGGKDMRKKSVNTLLVFGVVVAIILLMIWLFLGTTLVEDTSTEITPVPIEQTN